MVRAPMSFMPPDQPSPLAAGKEGLQVGEAGAGRGFLVCVVMALACQPLPPLSLSFFPPRCSPAVCYPLGRCQVPL